VLDRELKEIFESEKAIQILEGSPNKVNFVFKESDWIDPKQKKRDSSSSEEKVKKPKQEEKIDKREWRRLQIL
jgi:hypothetical protein